MKRIALKWRTSFLVIAISSFQPIHAQDVNMCDTNETPIIKRAYLDFAPSYFISPNPDGQTVGAITPNGNVLVSMTEVDESTNSAKRIHIPGSYDPVYTPDGKHITLPGMRVYSVEELEGRLKNATGSDEHRSGNLNFNSTFNSSIDGGVYQSLGIIPGKNGKPDRYRYIDDAQGASLSDYEISSTGAILPTQSNHERLCGNLDDQRLDLPMVSKDGQYLSILGREGTTIIYRIDDSGNCKKVMDLGFATGKVSFDYTGNKLAFHVDSVETNRGYFSGVSGYEAKDVFVMNIEKSGEGTEDEKWETRGMSRLTSSRKSATGSYYPRFTRDGNVLMTTQFNNENGRAFAFDVVDPNKAAWLSYNPMDMELNPSVQSSRCFPEGGSLESIKALGWLWGNVCSEVSNLREEDFALIPMGLTAAACEKLVKQKWQEMKSEYRASGFSGSVPEIESLLAVCPSDQTKIFSTQRVGYNPDVQQVTPRQLFNRQCIGCHESNRADVPKVNFENPTRVEMNSWLQKMFSEGEKRMPPSENSLADEEKETMKNYLLEVLKGNKKWGDD